MSRSKDFFSKRGNEVTSTFSSAIKKLLLCLFALFSVQSVIPATAAVDFENIGQFPGLYSIQAIERIVRGGRSLGFDSTDISDQLFSPSALEEAISVDGDRFRMSAQLSASKPSLTNEGILTWGAQVALELFDTSSGPLDCERTRCQSANVSGYYLTRFRTDIPYTFTLDPTFSGTNVGSSDSAHLILESVAGSSPVCVSCISNGELVDEFNVSRSGVLAPGLYALLLTAKLSNSELLPSELGAIKNVGFELRLGLPKISTSGSVSTCINSALEGLCERQVISEGDVTLDGLFSLGTVKKSPATLSVNDSKLQVRGGFIVGQKEMASSLVGKDGVVVASSLVVGLEAEGRITLEENARLAVSDFSLDSGPGSFPLAIGFEGASQGILELKNSSTLESAARIFIGTNLLGLGDGSGQLLTSVGSKMFLQADHSFITLANGIDNMHSELRGEMNLNIRSPFRLGTTSPFSTPQLHGAFVASSTLIINNGASNSIKVVVNGSIIEPPQEPSLPTLVSGSLSDKSIMKGDFIPLFNAGFIELGGQKISSRGNGKYSIGTATFETPVFTDRRHLVPELIRLNCNLSLCDQSLGLRAVLEANEPKTSLFRTPPKFEKQNALSEATALLASADDSEPNIKELANLANQAYGVFPQGGDVPGFKTLAIQNFDGLQALAVQAVDNNGAIVIAVRGTENETAAFSNWDANLGFLGIPTTRLRQYVANLSSFAGSVYAANAGTNNQIIFTGHSLGGGLAGLVANAYGAPAYMFNPAPISRVLGKFAAETASIFGIGELPIAANGALTVSLATDPLSGIAGNQLLESFPRYGQKITLLGDPFAYIASQTLSGLISTATVVAAQAAVSPTLGQSIAEIFQSFKLIGAELSSEHSMPILAYDIANPEQHPIISVENALGVVDAWTPEQVVDFALGRMGQQVLFPISDPESAKKSFSSPVVPGLTYYADPDLANGFMFEAANDSPRFSGVLLPLIGGQESDFAVNVLRDGWWSRAGISRSGLYFDFGDNPVDEFQLFWSAPGIVPSEASNLYFGLTFDSAGRADFALTPLSAVPIPASVWILGTALSALVLARRPK